MEFSRVSNRQFQIYRVHSQVRTSPSYRTFQLSAESRRFIAFSIWRSFAKLGQEWSKNELGDRKRWIITVSKIKQGKFLKTFSFIFRYFSLYLTFLSLNFKLIRMEIFFFFFLVWFIHFHYFWKKNIWLLLLFVRTTISRFKHFFLSYIQIEYSSLVAFSILISILSSYYIVIFLLEERVIEIII